MNGKLSKIIICVNTILLFFTFSVSLYAQNKNRIDYSKQIEDATPKPLPQEPVSDKLKSDAEDENLKGKVKQVVEERIGLSGVEKPIGRRFSKISEFNEKGNFLKQVYYEYRGVPTTVTVYGYIDKARVSNSNSISSGDRDLFLGEIIAGEENKINKVKSKADPRYEYRYEYKYLNGRLTEMQMYSNTGSKEMRYVSEYNKNSLLELAYISNGKLNSKYLITFDEKGNVISRKYFKIWEGDGKDYYNYIYKDYIFDNQGNWIERKIYELTNESGKENYIPIAIEFRKITYYP